jgi:hypothetical protein
MLQVFQQGHRVLHAAVRQPFFLSKAWQQAQMSATALHLSRVAML